MKLMIVEDEYHLRDRLAGGIDWEAHGIELVGTHASGLEALAAMQGTLPDLLLLDIRLPEMSGLELAGHALRRKPEAKVVLLSGYDDFEYAKAGIALGVVDYLLKPASNEEVAAAVRKGAALLAREFEEKHDLRRLRLKWKEQLPRLREDFLLNWLEGNYSAWEIERRGRDVQLDVAGKPAYAVASLDMDPPADGGGGKFGRDDIPLLQFALCQITRERLEGPPDASDDRLVMAAAQFQAYGDRTGAEEARSGALDDRTGMDAARTKADDQRTKRTAVPAARSQAAETLNGCIVARDRYGSTVVLFMQGESQSDHAFKRFVDAAVSDVLAVVKECLKVTASAGLGGVVREAATVGESYRGSRRALLHRSLYGGDIVVGSDDVLADAGSREELFRCEAAFVAAVESGNEARAREALNKLYALSVEGAETVADERESMLYWSGLFVRLAFSRGWRLRQVAGDDYDEFEQIGLLNREQFRQWLYRMTDSLLARARESHKQTRSRTMQAVLEAIDERVDADVTLYAVAEKLYLNSAYVSRLFKQEMGVPFSDYVMTRKMERAKLLLQRGELVYDVAERVGYRNVSYFAKAFQKYWGITPGEVKGRRKTES